MDKLFFTDTIEKMPKTIKEERIKRNQV